MDKVVSEDLIKDNEYRLKGSCAESVDTLGSEYAQFSHESAQNNYPLGLGHPPSSVTERLDILKQHGIFVLGHSHHTKGLSGDKLKAVAHIKIDSESGQPNSLDQLSSAIQASTDIIQHLKKWREDVAYPEHTNYRDWQNDFVRWSEDWNWNLVDAQAIHLGAFKKVGIEFIELYTLPSFLAENTQHTLPVNIAANANEMEKYFAQLSVDDQEIVFSKLALTINKCPSFFVVQVLDWLFEGKQVDVFIHTSSINTLITGMPHSFKVLSLTDKKTGVQDVLFYDSVYYFRRSTGNN